VPLRSVSNESAPLSTQGEQQAERARRRWADISVVDEYRAQHKGTGVDICRQRNRHRYEELPDDTPFDGYTPGGYLTRETDACLDCGLAYQVQRYEPYETKQGRKTIMRYRPAYNTTHYLEGPNGETYTLEPGQGVMHPRDYRDSAITALVNAHPEAQALGRAALKQRKTALARRAERQARED